MLWNFRIFRIRQKNSWSFVTSYTDQEEFDNEIFYSKKKNPLIASWFYSFNLYSTAYINDHQWKCKKIKFALSIRYTISVICNMPSEKLLKIS